MPVLFVGHGSPMNAIEDTEFSRGWRDVAAGIPHPKAILSISAHWETDGTQLTAMKSPRTIHDFAGFPPALYAVQYPAPGSPTLATATQEALGDIQAGLDTSWGLDHGTWSITKHMYPNADVPIVQMSLDYHKTPQYHYELAKQLAALRHKGVLILGSGNIVHNLSAVDWHNPDGGNDWANEAAATIRKLIVAGDHARLVDYQSLGSAVRRAIPTVEHYLPLLYALALKDDNDSIELFNEKTVLGSLSMTSVKIA
jgi:4,5-DOPA dioxygenase extradiol